MTSPRTDNHMARALQLAHLAKGGVAPRPAVGAVIVRDGSVVGEGATELRPGMHAEVAAIRAAGEATRGATMYCTLEPHAHQGVAPPCTEEIISAGITRVVCPIEDPNPRVNGNGFRRLRTAGIEVDMKLPESQKQDAEQVVEGFRMLTINRRPLFTLKYAMSLDGRIATSTGESKWITGETARAEAHRLRSSSDALVTGIGTVLADNPRLTARDSSGGSTGRPRLRVIVDTRARMPVGAALLTEPGDVLWVVGEGNEPSNIPANAELAVLPVDSGRVNLASLARLLGDRGCCDVMIEAGGVLAGGFIEARLVDRIAAFVAPVIIGGHDAPGPIATGFAEIARALKLDQVTSTELGRDILIQGRVRKD